MLPELAATIRIAPLDAAAQLPRLVQGRALDQAHRRMVAAPRLPKPKVRRFGPRYRPQLLAAKPRRSYLRGFLAMAFLVASAGALFFTIERFAPNLTVPANWHSFLSPAAKNTAVSGKEVSTYALGRTPVIATGQTRLAVLGVSHRGKHASTVVWVRDLGDNRIGLFAVGDQLFNTQLQVMAVNPGQVTLKYKKSLLHVSLSH